MIICYNIIKIDNEGITLENQNNNIYVCFDEYAKNYATETSLESSRCVATRDITTLSFTFYTLPKTKVVFKKQFLNDLISGKSAVSRFFELQNVISQSGYTTYDLS